MANPKTVTLSKNEPPRTETVMDKITRAAMEIVDDETEQRQLKTERLRKARLEREASGTCDAAKEDGEDAGKTPQAKTAKKS